MSDYVYLKNLNGQQIKPVTDLAAINMTTTNGIGVSTVNGGTIGIIDGYIESAYYTEMADPAVGAANVSSAYVDGGTAVAILGAYTVASAVDTAAPSQQKVPSEKAVVDALNNVVVSGVSYYAGTGINIDQGHTVSVANVPQSSVAGLENTLTGINTAVAAKQDAISAGYRMSLDGTTMNQQRYFAIESPTSNTIVMSAGHAYKITATTGSKTLDSEQIPANQFGLEGHAEIFVAGTGLIKTTSNVVLAQALEPDAVNNCTVRFHDGKAIISVEDHVAGYIVVSASGATAGTLPYALSTASNEYISFDASLNNMTLDLGGAVTNGEKHIVGNGYTLTVISGGVSCTSKTTFSNLGMIDVSVLGGTLTLGDVYIPNGATVSLNGGGLAVEKVTGDGGTIYLGGSRTSLPTGCVVESCIISGGPGATAGGRITAQGTFLFNAVEVTGCTATSDQGAFQIGGSLVSGTFSSCNIHDNRDSRGRAPAIYLYAEATVHVNGCTVTQQSLVSSATMHISGGTTGVVAMFGGASVTVAGEAKISGIINGYGSENKIEILSGAVVDLSGVTSSAPIAANGGITLHGGHYTAPTAITYSSGSNSGSRTFEDLEIHGTTVTNLGLIYGATVYSNEGDDHEIIYTEDNGATSSSVFISGETVYVVPGALMKVANT